MRKMWQRLVSWLRWRWYWRQNITRRLGEIADHLMACDRRVERLDDFVKSERAEFEAFVAQLVSFQEGFERARGALENEGTKFDLLGGRLKDLQDILDRIHWAPGVAIENPGAAECDCGHKSIHRILLPDNRMVCPDCHERERQKVDPMFKVRA